MVSLLSLSRMQWNQEAVELRNAGFPAGETGRLESRRHDYAVHGELQPPKLDAHRCHEPERSCRQRGLPNSKTWRNIGTIPEQRYCAPTLRSAI